ncbi:hypothetical protein [Fervidobacterium thailandense]|uniref:DUF4203 domain-containing protein n=1 Tax=Fervidobacterium thailandense TaxID=1008305 RepID=A0A1E3G4X3_9BACT|nr:hypothetical protein [Fervidobacterium thailandense]ODN31336.1 hypothetical protein A4H02_00810 [Fervidobacterium thailandense]
MNVLPEFQFFESLESTLREMIQGNWFIVLLVAGVVYLFPGYLELLSITGVGFVLGSMVVFPIVVELLNTLLPESAWISQSLSTHAFWWSLAFGALCAILLYSLYKSVLFLAGLFTGTLLAYYFFSVFGQVGLETRVIIILGLAVGLLTGVFAVKKSSFFVGLIGLVLASLVLSYILLETLLAEFLPASQGVRSAILLGVSLTLFLVRFLTWRKK